jgi:RHS repeat-associated protein
VQAASTTYPAATLNTVAPGAPLAIPKNGYLYIWVSNETQGWDVFFDNLCVQHKQGPLLEENHYYPFGLTMAGISDMAIKTNYAENKFRYNEGTELQNKEFSDGTGWEMYETSLRGYDPQIGRFAQMDPLAAATDFMNPYQYSMDNPVMFNDPTGAKQRPLVDRNCTYCDMTGFTDSHGQSAAMTNNWFSGGYGTGAQDGLGNQGVGDHSNSTYIGSLFDALEQVANSLNDGQMESFTRGLNGDWSVVTKDDISNAHFITDHDGNSEISYTYGYGDGNVTETGLFDQNLGNDYFIHGVIKMFGSFDPNDNQGGGNNEAAIAKTFLNGNMQTLPYSMSDKSGTIDCSRCTMQIAAKAGYSIPRTAYSQAKWYQQHGFWSTNLADAQPGDHIFWLRGENLYHTGVISNISTAGIISVVQANVNDYQAPSIHQFNLQPDGTMRDFDQPFVGIGRYTP